MDSRPYPAGHQPRLTEILLALRAAQRAGECCLDAVAVTLVAVVASQEEQLGYSKPPLFHTGQLLAELGLSSWTALKRARMAAVAAGWLHYEHRGRNAGAYWTIMPRAFHVERSYAPNGYDRGNGSGPTSTISDDVAADDRRSTSTIAADEPVSSPPNVDDTRRDSGPTSTIAAHPSEEKREEQLLQLPREVIDRLEPLRDPSLGIDLGEDLTGWVRETDGLTRAQVAEVLELRHLYPPKDREGRPVRLRWPTHLAQLRETRARQRVAAARVQAELEAAARKAAKLAAFAAPLTVPPPLPADLDRSIVDRWEDILAAARPPRGSPDDAAWALWLEKPTIRALGRAGDTLWLHVPTALHETTIRNRYGRQLAEAAAQVLAVPILGVAFAVNGHQHPTAAAHAVAIGGGA